MKKEKEWGTFSLRLDEMSIFLLQVAKVRLHDFDRCKFHVMLLFGMHLHFMQCHFQIGQRIEGSDCCLGSWDPRLYCISKCMRFHLSIILNACLINSLEVHNAQTQIGTFNLSVRCWFSILLNACPTDIIHCQELQIKICQFNSIKIQALIVR